MTDFTQDYERASKAFKIWYGVILEHKEHALRGWNWGKAEFAKAELNFNVRNQPAFEIPYSEISNTNLAGKNEVAVEFNLGAEPVQNGTNGHKEGATMNRGRKAAAARDELVEMRFYIPGTVAKQEKDEDGEEKSVNGDEVEEQNAANLFYETLMDKAEIGDVAGDTFATFLDVLHLTPRYPIFLQSTKIATDSTIEDDSTSICTRAPSDCAVKPTITRFNTNLSRNSSFYPRMMKFIHLLPLVSILHYGKGKPATLLSSCSSSSMKTLRWN